MANFAAAEFENPKTRLGILKVIKRYQLPQFQIIRSKNQESLVFFLGSLFIIITILLKIPPESRFFDFSTKFFFLWQEFYVT